MEIYNKYWILISFLASLFFLTLTCYPVSFFHYLKKTQSFLLLQIYCASVHQFMLLIFLSMISNSVISIKPSITICSSLHVFSHLPFPFLHKRTPLCGKSPPKLISFSKKFNLLIIDTPHVLSERFSKYVFIFFLKFSDGISSGSILNTHSVLIFALFIPQSVSYTHLTLPPTPYV